MIKKTPLLVLVAALSMTACGGSSQHKYHTPYGESAHAPNFGAPPKNRPLALSPSSTPTGEMFDTVTLATVPHKPFAVAGYTSGYWPTYIPLVRAFPGAHHVSIAISASHRAQCLDVEPGDASPSQAATWVKQDKGFSRPCIYANLSTMPSVKANLERAGLARSRYLLWDANWTYHAHLDAGYDATQWTDHAFGRNLDESTVSYAFLGIKPQPPKPQNPVCYHHRIPKAQCAKVKQHVAALRQAQVPIQRKYAAGNCGALAQRDRWFANKIRSDHSRRGRALLKKRQGALAATRRVERRRNCSGLLRSINQLQQLIAADISRN